MERISWERIRIALQEEDKKGTTDNMFRLEAVAQAQLDSCEKELREILGKMNMRDVGGTEPEWALSNKDYQALKQKHLGEV